MFCPNCGIQNLERAKFCMKCGKKLQKIERSDDQEEKYPHTTATVLGYFFAAIGGLISLLFVLHLFMQDDPRAKYHAKIILLIIGLWIILAIVLVYSMYTFGIS